MTGALLAAALLAAGAAPLAPAPRAQLCIPEQPRATPHRHFEPHDKWQNDERAFA